MPTSYHYTLFHNHCLAYAGELLEGLPEREDGPRMQRPAIGVIVLSAMALEAAANHTVERLFRPMLHVPKLAALKLARDRIAQETNPLQKLDLLAEAVWGEGLDTGEEPWQSAGDLYALRNSLVHYQSRPVSTSEEGTVFLEKARLRNRARALGLWSIFEEGGTWLDVFLNRPCAQWAVGTGNDAVDALRQPPWTKGN